MHVLGHRARVGGVGEGHRPEEAGHVQRHRELSKPGPVRPFPERVPAHRLPMHHRKGSQVVKTPSPIAQGDVLDAVPVTRHRP